MACLGMVAGALVSSFQGALADVLMFLRNSAAERAANLLNLGKNAEALAHKMSELKAIRDDMENELKRQELQPGMVRSRRASEWLASVDALHDEVLQLQSSLERRSTFFESCSFGSLRSGSALGTDAVHFLKNVGELRDQKGEVERQLVVQAPPPIAESLPRKARRLVGGKEALLAIQGYLKDEQVGVVGIYGMGGGGKTTLLVEINNHFLTEPNPNFEVVIFATVSSEVNVFKLQEDIGLRLGFRRANDGDRSGSPLPKDEVVRKETLYKALDKKKFLLLLDDLWQKLDLEKIGIPDPDTSTNRAGKKIIFTTRSEEVCSRMGAPKAKVKVGLLGKEESWELFRSFLDKKVNLDNNVEIRQLAEVVVKKCGGLPLTLSTIGSAMSNKPRPAEWRRTKKKLERSPDEIKGMEDVLSLLKFSFDELKDDVTKECLLYCALFPEDCLIKIEQLVDYWLGEGFLGDDLTLAEARDEGVCIIGSLKEACLLESGRDATTVKMHDAVREMALWLTGGKFDKMKRFIICKQGEKQGLKQLQEVETWEVAGRISVNQEDSILELPSPEFQCHNLETLLISGEIVGRGGVQIKQALCIRQTFWESMLVLRVLDLSRTDIEELPVAFGSLANLRHLNLSNTPIRQLPKELGNLVNLRYLSLAHTWRLREIPREAIFGLSKLQRLDLFDCGHQWCGDSSGLKLTDIDCYSPLLEELSLIINDSLPVLDELANSNNLRKCNLTLLKLDEIEDLTSPSFYASLQKLEGLQHLKIFDRRDEDCMDWEIHGGPVLDPPLFQSLRILYICGCPFLTDVNWVGQLRSLESLDIKRCDRLEQILVRDGEGGVVAADDDGDVFPKLRRMELYQLRKLRAISTGRPLRFPSLERLKVRRCYNLRRLPLGPQSCPKIKWIRGEQSWWDALEWDDYDNDSRSSSIGSSLPTFLY